MEEPMSQENNNSIETIANQLIMENSNIKSLILAIQKTILDHAYSLSEKYAPKSIIESRFTPAQEAFDRGILSCGAMANISSEMLRHLGYKVKLVHGESKESVDHAWITVYDKETSSWVPYDLTRDGAEVPSTNVPKDEVDSWEDIREQIEKDHETLHERRKARGL